MTPDSDRDMDRLLGAVLPGTLAPASAECLDAERLAAWSEGALDAEEARAVETHLAGCARCQALAAVFARTEPAPAVSATPGVVIPMRRRWPMGWIAPLAAAAAAVTLWIVWPGRESPTSIATAPTTAPAQTMARVEDKQKAQEGASPAPSTFAENKDQRAVQPPADADAQRIDKLQENAAAAKRDQAARAAEPSAAPKTIAPRSTSIVAGAPPPPSPAPPPPPAATPAAPPPLAQTGQVAGGVRPAAPPTPTVTGANESVSVRAEPQGQAMAQAAAKLEATVPPVIEIVTAPPMQVDAISEAVLTRQAGNAGGGGAGRAGRGGGGGGRGGGAQAVPPPPPPVAQSVVAPRWRILEGTRVER